MAWTERIREAAYTTAQGERLTFSFEDVSQNLDIRGTAHDFPDAKETYVQRTGRTSRRYPLRVFFSGSDHDLQANEFMNALTSPGVGTLEHPFYGKVKAVPFGPIERKDPLRRASNQSIFELTFWETLVDLIYPSAQTDPAAQVLTGVAAFNAAAAEEFKNSAQLAGAVEQASFGARYEVLLNNAASLLAPIAETEQRIEQQFKAVLDSINSSIAVLVADPLTLAFQTTVLLQAPARAAALISDRLEAYQNLARRYTQGDDAVAEPSLGPESSNNFHVNDLFASAAVSGVVLAVVNNTFTNRTEALGAAETLLQLMEEVTNWRDDNFTALGEIDEGGLYQQLQETVAIAAGFLVEISFTLRQERRFTLTRARSPIDLAAELYGSVDDQLDFLAESNKFSWQEHLELPAGREIVYYV